MGAVFAAVVSFLSANPELVALLVGVLTPLLTSIVQQPGWSKTVRSVVGGVVSLVVGFVTAAAAGALSDATSLFAILGVVLVSAEAAYEKLWQPSGATNVIELKTSRNRTDDYYDGVIDGEADLAA